MQKFDELLRELDLNFFGSGKHKMTIEKAMELKKEDKVFILDVRSKQENDYLKFEFATNIPTSEIPDRVQEIPKDKTVAIFCTGATRATIVYTYLKVAGYEDVKIITNNINDIAGLFKPGYVLKNS
ncbi:putative rhodanese-related sulfurtransferase [Clostridium tepidiprofundi DSM 19306]|uniref:Putative rhodanese-related sulfurtransferase n=1 Tax=Clostridium tepidiprofundi DSM 19306 TaxID=1121338 RepID=A0A151B4W4_9CLOT|nr:rhodanese-like domain-containing protein [Clostridium tepidiprofundi]KYH34697.1 putative rhodanese-related sulfurtransferase [Clostridium tepidiprofundi DSM 19306]